MDELRRRIDEIDEGIIRLFRQRMETVTEIAKYKQEHNLPGYDPERERQKLEGLPDDLAALFTLLFELSRAEQKKVIG